MIPVRPIISTSIRTISFIYLEPSISNDSNSCARSNGMNSVRNILYYTECNILNRNTNREDF